MAAFLVSGSSGAPWLITRPPADGPRGPVGPDGLEKPVTGKRQNVRFAKALRCRQDEYLKA